MPWYNLAPSEFLMGRKLHATVPQITKHLLPKWPFLRDFQHKNKTFRLKQKCYYDRIHRVRPRPDLEERTGVWVSLDGDNTLGQIVGPALAPRSYLVETPSGHLGQKRSHLTEIPDNPEPNEEQTPQDLQPSLPQPEPQTQAQPEASRSPIATRSCTGTAIKPPLRYGREDVMGLDVT